MTLESISTTGAPTPGGHYAQAVAAGDLVFVSGQLPIGADGTHRPHASFEEQVRQVFDNVFAILAAAGASPKDLARVTVYIVGIERWAEFNRLCAELLGDWRPARTVVPVPELHFGYLVEVDAIAVRSARST